MIRKPSDPALSSLKSNRPAFSDCITALAVTALLLSQSMIFGAVGHVITPAAHLPAPLPSAAHGNLLGGDDLMLEGQPLNWLGKREVETCDEIGLCTSTLFLIRVYHSDY